MYPTIQQKEQYMCRAIELAKLGEGYTSPNPMVGCVVVKDGRVISEGYHERYGEFHAERNALLRCTEDTTGADLYVTLEPCCHHGKTPPCTDIIIEKKIGRVFVGSLDSNPLVAGNGVRILEEAGIEVESGILEAECRALNEVFYHYMETGRPFVVMKYAMTLDGKIACVTGDSKWVTGEAAREHVHLLRKRYAGILVGIGTVLADDPMLNVRLGGEAEDTALLNPVRIVCDSTLRIPEDAKLVRTAKEIPTIVACCAAKTALPEAQEKIYRLTEAGVKVLSIEADPARVDMRELMQKLAAEKIDSVLVEGGAGIHASMLEAGLVDKVYAYIAGKLVGGKQAPTPVGGTGIAKMADAICLTDIRTEMFGEDICVTGYVRS